MQTESPQMSGNAEGNIDKIVFDRFFTDQSTGTCIEVGAARPDWLSIGALFRSKGWDVIAIEPNPVFAEMHRGRSHTVLQYACGDHDEDNVDFSVVDSHNVAYRDGSVSFESWSSLSIKSDYSELKPNLSIKHIKVNLRRLDSLLHTYRPTLKSIDLITADVEGWELDVLAGLDFSKYTPRVLVIENLFHKAEYQQFMHKRGYVLWRCTPPNDVYVRANELPTVERIMSGMRASAVTLVQRARVRLGRLKRRLLREAKRKTDAVT
jgi:FkbM family methyltransferase